VQDSHFHRNWSEQSFPRVDSLSLGCTIFSAGGMTQLCEWSRSKNHGQAFPWADLFSLGCSMISARGMDQLGEWYRLRNPD
jgi:hypothetical protein